MSGASCGTVAAPSPDHVYGHSRPKWALFENSSSAKRQTYRFQAHHTVVAVVCRVHYRNIDASLLPFRWPYNALLIVWPPVLLRFAQQPIRHDSRCTASTATEPGAARHECLDRLNHQQLRGTYAHSFFGIFTDRSCSWLSPHRLPLGSSPPSIYVVHAQVSPATCRDHAKTDNPDNLLHAPVAKAPSRNVCYL